MLFTSFFPELRWSVDSNQYFILGKNLVENDTFNMFFDEKYLESIRLPGYPILMGFVAGSISYNLLIFIQVLLSAAKVLLFYQLSFFIGLNPKWQKLGMFIVAVNPIDILLSNHFLTESIFSFLIYFSLLLILKEKRITLILIAAFALSVAAYLRGQALGIFVVLLVFASFFNQKNRLVYGLSFLLLISPWFIRNYNIFNRIFFTDAPKVVTLFYTLPQVLEAVEMGSAQENFTYYKNLGFNYNWSNAKHVNDYINACNKEIYKVISENPKAFLEVYLKKFTGIFLSPGRGHIGLYFSNKLLFYLITSLSLLLVIFSLIGFIIMAFKLVVKKQIRQNHFSLLLVILVLFIVGTSAFSAIDARFKNPAELGILLLACSGFQQLKFKKYV